MSVIRVEKPALVTDIRTVKPNKSPSEFLEVFYAIFGDFPAWQLGRNDGFDEQDVVRRAPTITGRAELLEVSWDKNILLELQKARGKRRPIRIATVLYPKPHMDQTFAKIVSPACHAGRDAVIRTESRRG